LIINSVATLASFVVVDARICRVEMIVYLQTIWEGYYIVEKG